MIAKCHYRSMFLVLLLAALGFAGPARAQDTTTSTLRSYLHSIYTHLVEVKADLAAEEDGLDAVETFLQDTVDAMQSGRMTRTKYQERLAAARSDINEIWQQIQDTLAELSDIKQDLADLAPTIAVTNDVSVAATYDSLVEMTGFLIGSAYDLDERAGEGSARIHQMSQKFG